MFVINQQRSMAKLEVGSSYFTHTNMHHFDQSNFAALKPLLTQQAQFMLEHPDSKSVNFHVNEDHTRTLNYVQYNTEEAYLAQHTSEGFKSLMVQYVPMFKIVTGPYKMALLKQEGDVPLVIKDDNALTTATHTWNAATPETQTELAKRVEEYLSLAVKHGCLKGVLHISTKPPPFPPQNYPVVSKVIVYMQWPNRESSEQFHQSEEYKKFQESVAGLVIPDDWTNGLMYWTIWLQLVK